MKANIGAKFLSSKDAQPREKAFEVRDTRLIGFLLRVQPSGVRSYNAAWYAGGKDHRISLGKVGVLTPDEARERCQIVLGNVAAGRPPLYGIDGADTESAGPTLGDFIRDTYEPWMRAHRSARRANDTLDRIKRNFGMWFPRVMTGITVEEIENWRVERLNGTTGPKDTPKPVKAATVTKDLQMLSGVFTRAVKLRKIPENVVRQVEKPRVDRNPRVRFLSQDEEARLRAALADSTRNDPRRAALMPAALISINTGLRRGELLALTWADVMLTGENPHITVQGEDLADHQGAKSKQTRHIPLNVEALAVLKDWRARHRDTEKLFDNVKDFHSSWETVLKRAKITRFRWHDLRHHFASRLVQKGVPLNTVRDLMGHADIKMTLRYAHLAPDQRKEAVELLVADAATATSSHT